MTQCTISILLVEDDEEDAFITEELLQDAPGKFALTWVSSYAEALKTASSEPFDVCLVDYRIGGETGIEFLESASSRGIVAPMILLTGVGQHDIDVAASEFGAADFLDKASLTPVLLERAIRYAIAHASALQALAHQQQVLATTLESLSGGIAAFDASGNVVAANNRFETLMRQMRSPVGSDGAKTPVELAHELLSTIEDRGRDHVIEMDSPNGKSFEIRISPVPGRGSVFLIVDVTDQKTLQCRILEAKTAAEKANTAKSAFLAKVSHELRTPLNGVFGMAQLLKLTTLDSSQTSQLDRLMDSAMGLMALIEDLLDISMAEQGRFNISHEPLDLTKIIAESCDIASAASGDDVFEITQVVNLESSFGLFGDSKRIRQIVNNFLSNAKKFSNHGMIEVHLNERPNGWIRLSVLDDGDGINPDDQERIFERFTQLELHPDHVNPGVGLGLSISRELVEQMNGRIGVISSPGVGSEFWFELPLRSESAALSKCPAPRVTSSI